MGILTTPVRHRCHGAGRLAVVAALALLLAGCGGGGGGGGGGLGPVAPGTPSAGPGTVQMLDLASGTLVAPGLDGATFDAPAALSATGVAFRQVNAGSSLQGSLPGSLGAQPDEPYHVATVTGFYLSCFELTQAQWTALATRAGLSGAANLTPWLGAVPPAVVGGVAPAPDRAAGGISYDLAAAAVAGFNAAAAPGQPTLRLPSEAEWEHACRAASTTRYAWGDDEDPATVAAHALVRESRRGLGADLVGGGGAGARLANAFGFYDMEGNLWEWTQSGPGPDAVLRGGSWSDNLLSARSANRQSLDRAIPYALAGVRLVLVP